MRSVKCKASIKLVFINPVNIGPGDFHLTPIAFHVKCPALFRQILLTERTLTDTLAGWQGL